MTETVITLSMPPSTNNLFLNGRGGAAGRPRSPEYRAWAKEAGWALASQRPRAVPGRVVLLIEIEEPKTKHRQDCTNRIKAVEDLLVDHGVIEGDDQRFVRAVTVRWADVAGVRVTVQSE